MPRVAKELSAASVRRLARPGLHAVGGVAGLHLQVTPTGGRSWVLRTVIGGRRRDLGLGGYPSVTLAAARERARELRERIGHGADPVAERRAAAAAAAAARERDITFDKAVRKFMAAKRSEFRSEKHAKQWSATLATYASPVVGDLPVDRIELAHIVRILEPIWSTKTETAKRLRGRIEAVLAWATVRGHRSGDNPARWKGHLDAVLPKPGKIATVQHFAALAIDDLPGFTAALRERRGTAARALEFTILTAARSGEVRGATWSEVDLEGRTWTIPGTRMKAGREHRVPLSDEAVAVLRRVPRLAGSEYVFPAARGGKLSDMSLTAVLRRMGVPVTAHGFRSTFRDWCAERTGYAREVVEMALAHAIESKVEAAYRRGDLFERRRRLMDEWAQFSTGIPVAGEVVALRG